MKGVNTYKKFLDFTIGAPLGKPRLGEYDNQHICARCENWDVFAARDPECKGTKQPCIASTKRIYKSALDSCGKFTPMISGI